MVINYPKTGSTYMRACIKKLYLESTAFNKLFRKDDIFKELQLPKIYGNASQGYTDQHGVVRQIPESHKKHPIITVVRNPLQRIISSYHFEWWKKNPMYDLATLKSTYPNYPDIDLMTFAKMLNNPELTPQNLLPDFAQDLGYNTRLFLVFYSDNPKMSAQKLVSDTPKITDVIKSDIHFLKQEQLETDLMEYISKHTSKDASLIASVADKNSGTYKPGKKYDKEFTDYVLKMEYHLFKTFYPEILSPS